MVYLPAGTYRVNRPISLGSKSRITLRGAGPDKTVIMAQNQGSGVVICPADGGDWWYPDRLEAGHHGQPEERGHGADGRRHEGAGRLSQRRHRPDLPALAEERPEAAVVTSGRTGNTCGGSSRASWPRRPPP